MQLAPTEAKRRPTFIPSCDGCPISGGRHARYFVRAIINALFGDSSSSCGSVQETNACGTTSTQDLDCLASQLQSIGQEKTLPARHTRARCDCSFSILSLLEVDGNIPKEWWLKSRCFIRGSVLKEEEQTPWSLQQEPGLAERQGN